MGKIKLCGLSRKEDVLAVNELLPDYAGFIIGYPKSPRSVDALRAKELCCHLDRRIQAVGVFVNSPIELPIRMLREGTISLAQLHGQEDEEYIHTLLEKTGCPVIKAFSVKGPGDIERARRCPATYVLLDHDLGKNGQVIDWSLLQGLDREFFLAGGLGSENVAEAIEKVWPFAVDMNSACETDGRKDARKMRLAVEAAREAFSGKGA